MKKCNKCGETKEVSAFSKSRKAKDGLQHNCKVCCSEWQRNNRDKVNSFMREWKRNNREKVNDYQRNHRANATPCVYRIKHKVNGSYYLGQTKRPLFERTQQHFSQNGNPSSFSGLNKDDWIVEPLCYGTAKQVKQIEKALLDERVGIDPNCLNKNK